ncbi:MAG: hypothetical protein JXQ73_04530 [Phycisphaerae bacterium]|nr:hypothetical protein [Phycisphaerae bacterium]
MTYTIVLPLLALSLTQANVDPGPEASTSAERLLREDATLNDLAFIDPELGWAVGNRGAVLRTRDGGRTWQTLPSPTDATLNAVHFTDRRVGYVAGGRAFSDGSGCYGVLLRTDDGGNHWRPIGGEGELGWLTAVWADADGTGWALGCPTPMRAGGLWRFSVKEGRVYPAGDRPLPDLLAACFDRQGRGIAVGNGAACVVLRRGELTPQRRAVSFRGRLTGVAMLGERGACMVGDEATVFTSPDEGRTWSAAQLDLPTGVRELLDLVDVTFADERDGWAIGENGPYILRTTDGGRTWSLQTTGLEAPLRSIAAIDARIVVAVGEGGLIALSQDAGQTWSVVRNGDRRLGALMISTARAEWTWPMTAHLVGKHRCRTGYLQITEGPADSGAFRWAANACGVSAVQTVVGFSEPPFRWYPAAEGPTARALMAYWSERLDRDAESSMRRQIVAAVRSLRPSLVLIDRAEPDAPGDLVATSVAAVARRAVTDAARDDVMPELRELGLTPHRVDRVLALTGDRPGHHRGKDAEPADRVHVGFTDGFHPLLGSDSRLAGMRAAGYLGLPTDDSLLGVRLKIVEGEIPPSRKSVGPLTGIRLPEGARLAWIPPEDKARLAEQEAACDALAVASGMGRQRANPARLVELAMRAAKRFPGSLAPADALYQAACQEEQLGRHRAAAEVWRAFLDLGQAHPAWTRVIIRRAVVSASAEHYMSLPIRPKDPLEGARLALDQLGRLCTERPQIAHRPEVLFAQAHCTRILGQSGPTRQWYRRCSSGQAPGWSSAAAAELWLLETPGSRQGESPRQIVEARRSLTPVNIDGILDDAVWQGGSAPVLLDNGGRKLDPSQQTQVRLAWDDAYLHLAAIVRTTHGREGPPPGHSPQRDQLHPDWPAVEWFLDVDRDAATWIHIGVDELAGCIDACNEDLSWSFPTLPTPLAGAWQYVIQHEPDVWRVEMAVPMVSLFPRRPVPGQVWAIQIVRRPGAEEARMPDQWLAPQPGRHAAGEYFALLLFAGSE